MENYYKETFSCQTEEKEKATVGNTGSTEVPEHADEQEKPGGNIPVEE